MSVRLARLLGVSTLLLLVSATPPSWTMESMSVVFCEPGTLYGCGPIQTTFDFVLREATENSTSAPFTDTSCHAEWVQPAYPTDWTQCGNTTVSWKFVNATSAPTAVFSMTIQKQTEVE
jgi:hypothetical protein